MTCSTCSCSPCSCNRQPYNPYSCRPQWAQGPKGLEGPQGPRGPFGLLPEDYTFQTTDYTVLENVQLIEFGDGDQTCTLPPVTGDPGEAHIIKKSGTGGVTLVADGDETIDGSNSIFLNQWNSYTVFSNGTAWILI